MSLDQMRDANNLNFPHLSVCCNVIEQGRKLREFRTFLKSSNEWSLTESVSNES